MPADRNNPSKREVLSGILFAVYLAFLTWLILFKAVLSGHGLVHMRAVNFVPFAAPPDGYRMSVREPVENLIAFIPFGVFGGILFGHPTFAKTLLGGFCLSLFYEIAQYAFSLGASDVTDLIMNTAGALIGILVLGFLARFVGKPRAARIVNASAIVFLAAAGALFCFLWLYNRG